MKKFLSFLFILVLFPCAILLTACGEEPASVKYKVYIDDAIVGGTVTANVTEAEVDSLVEITLAADEGFQLMDYKYNNTREMYDVEQEGGIYTATFKMPEGGAFVTAVFERTNKVAPGTLSKEIYGKTYEYNDDRFVSKDCIIQINNDYTLTINTLAELELNKSVPYYALTDYSFSFIYDKKVHYAEFNDDYSKLTFEGKELLPVEDMVLDGEYIFVSDSYRKHLDNKNIISTFSLQKNKLVYKDYDLTSGEYTERSYPCKIAGSHLYYAAHFISNAMGPDGVYEKDDYYTYFGRIIQPDENGVYYYIHDNAYESMGTVWANWSTDAFYEVKTDDLTLSEGVYVSTKYYDDIETGYIEAKEVESFNLGSLSIATNFIEKKYYTEDPDIHLQQTVVYKRYGNILYFELKQDGNGIYLFELHILNKDTAILCFKGYNKIFKLQTE